MEIATDPAIYGALMEHLHRSEVEELAFMAGRPGPGSAEIEVFDILIVSGSDLATQTDYHLHLADHARGLVIRWAHERSAILIEAHAHRSRRPAAFSPSDLWGLEQWVPHVRWRLGYRPYSAFVFADDSFDALAWQGRAGELVAVTGLRVGEGLASPTGLTHAALTERGYDR